MISIHGLFGFMNNWKSINMNSKISKRRNTLLLDARNHGHSDHHEDMSYEVMADDIVRLADKLSLEKFTVLGHSMGGKIGNFII